jgi:hypothetical protein
MPNKMEFPIPTFAELIKQREFLQAQIAQARQTELADAIG